MSVKNLIRSGTATALTAPLPGRAAEQVRNSAGGCVWRVDLWKQLERFLILGTEEGTFYVPEQKLTVDKAASVLAALREDGSRVVEMVVSISEARRAPRKSPALFVLALASAPRFADPETVTRAFAALPRVAHSAAELCRFVEFVKSLRGWGRGLRNAVAEWYTQQPAAALAHQLTKDRERVGWSHRDLLRVSHAKAPTTEHNAVFRWAVTGEVSGTDVPLLSGFEALRGAASEREVVRLIETRGLTHEHVPDQWKGSSDVWEALLPLLPYEALVQNLGPLTDAGVLASGSPSAALAVLRLTDRLRVSKARVRPVSLLGALMAYKAQGNAVDDVADALDEAFHMAFAGLDSSGKRVLVGVDASRSMQSSCCAGLPHVTAAAGAAAMAMGFARAESGAVIVAFHDEIRKVEITPNDRLDGVVAKIGPELRGTNASLPIRWAAERGLLFDAFVLITDTETWSGPRHPAQALEAYRHMTGLPTKLVSVAMAATPSRATRHRDPLELYVVGFDASVPTTVTEFLRG